MIKDGGPAFPTPIQHDDHREDYPGLSLRDYFAAKAMTALIIGRTWDKHARESLMDTWAVGAYAVADAMIKAREQSN